MFQGEEAFHCETCKEKTAATKHLRLHRFPDVLVLHIKRFKHKARTHLLLYLRHAEFGCMVPAEMNGAAHQALQAQGECSHARLSV